VSEALEDAVNRWESAGVKEKAFEIK